MRALLALEAQRDGLLQQLDQYAGLDAVHRRQMVELHARHAQALKDSQASVCMCVCVCVCQGGIPVTQCAIALSSSSFYTLPAQASQWAT